MTAVRPGVEPETAPTEPALRLSLPAQLRAAGVSTWLELPRVLGASGITLLAVVPVVVAVLVGQLVPDAWWLVALALLPLALLLTGLARVAEGIRSGGRARVRDVMRVDPVLAALAVVAVTAAERSISAGGPLAIAGFVLAAAAALILPLALSYGAVRDRAGIAALRGGVILAFFRPSSTLTIAALGCLGAFAIAATAGVLALVVPCLLFVFANGVVAGELADIDELQGGRT